MHFLNISSIIEATEAEGPGLRFVIWVQGCLKRCKGCCNKELLQIKPTNIINSQNIITQLENAYQQYPLEGITFLGGEPLLQAQGLADIAKRAKELGLSVMIFTGYQLHEINENDFKGVDNLLKFTDVLIDGEFDCNKIETTRNWVGSTNQRFHYLTDFYSNEIETREISITNELRIKLDGKISVNGLPFKLK